MDKEMIDYIRKQDETSNIGEIFETVRDTVFNPVKSEEELISYLTSVFESFANDEDKIRLVDFLIDIVQKEAKYPCMYKGIPQQHYTTMENICKWVSFQRNYYQNQKMGFLDRTITWEFSEEQQKGLYEGLIKDKFISDSCDYNSFCYVFGNNNYSDKKGIERLMWLNNKQLLRELLEGVKNPDITKKEMEDAVPMLFIDKEGQPIKLAKNKVVESIDRDFIKNLIDGLFSKKKDDSENQIDIKQRP